MKYDPVMLRIFNEKQLFVDDLLIESVENVGRYWHQPVKYEGNPVIRKDRPWEYVMELTVNGFQILYDAECKLFKFWCINTKCGEVKEGQGALGDSTYSILYAESSDGVNWIKPECGAEIDGMKTNTVIQNGYNLTSVIDPHETDRKKRYKGIYTPHRQFGDVDGVLSVVSEDGIKWEVLDTPPAFGFSGAHQDDVAVMSYDPNARMFIMNMRHYDMYAINSDLKNPTVGFFTPPYYPMNWSRMAKRRVWQTESSDAVNWSEPYIVLSPEDGLDDLDEAYYGFSQYRVGAGIIGFLTTINYVPNHLGARLLYSRDGKNWIHLNNRKLLIDRGPEGSWDEFMTTLPSPCIEFNDELYFFYGGAINHHDWWLTGAREGIDAPEAYDRNKVRYSLGLAKMRMDGFASLKATMRPGILITRHFISDGRYLEFNARCSKGGAIQAEIVDAHGEVLPGYGRDDCDAFTGDDIRHVFSWKGQKLLPPVETNRPSYPAREDGRLRKIRFYINKAEIFSFTMKKDI
jgi:hypothetical protein